MKRLLVVSALFVFVGCQKAQRDEDNSVNTCEDISLAQTIFADAYKQIRLAAFNTQGIAKSETTLTTIYGCEEIKSDTLSNPRNLIIDYKYLGCQALEVERYGRLIADFFGEFGKEGSAVDISFSNYFYREYEVNGKIRVIFKERNSEDLEVHTFYVQSGTVNDGTNTLTWTASQTWTVESKPNKPEVFVFSGNSNGTNRRGNIFKSNTITDNIMSDDCLYVKSGKIQVEVRNLSLRILDYGSGSCDRSAEAAINGQNYKVTIP